MSSEWQQGLVADLATFANRERIPLSGTQRAERPGVYPYWGANGVLDYVDAFIFEGTRILVGEDGTVRQPDGRAVVHWVTGRFWVNNHAHVVWVKDYDCSARWLYYALSAANVDAFVTGAVQPKLSMRSLKQVPLQIPPPVEQSMIASILGALDDKIDSNRRLGALLEETAATLFRARFVDFVGLEDFEESDIGPIPRGWTAGHVRDLAHLRYGKALKEADRIAGDVAVVGSSGVVGAHNTPLFKGPVVVVGRKGTAGRVTWVGRDAWPIDTTFVADPIRDWHAVYVYFALSAANLTQLVADSAVPGLNREAAEERAIVLPSSSDARWFTSVAQPLLAQNDALSNEAATLGAVRDTLLPKLISGEIRVPDTSDPEEVIGPVAEELASAVS